MNIFSAPSPRWDAYYLGVAMVTAHMSKDPRTWVGSVIVGPDREIRATGFNGFPRDIEDKVHWLQDKEQKLKLIVHAEMNCICNAVRVGVSLKGCALFTVCTDGTGEIWGGPPCTNCAKHVIQAGITQVVSYPWKQGISTWTDDVTFAKGMLNDAGVGYREVIR